MEVKKCVNQFSFVNKLLLTKTLVISFFFLHRGFSSAVHPGKGSVCCSKVGHLPRCSLLIEWLHPTCWAFLRKVAQSIWACSSFWGHLPGRQVLQSVLRGRTRAVRLNFHNMRLGISWEQCLPILLSPLSPSHNSVSPLVWTCRVPGTSEKRMAELLCPNCILLLPLETWVPLLDDHLRVYLLVYGKDSFLTCKVFCDCTRCISFTIQPGFLPWALPFPFCWLKFHWQLSCEWESVLMCHLQQQQEWPPLSFFFYFRGKYWWSVVSQIWNVFYPSSWVDHLVIPGKCKGFNILLNKWLALHFSICLDYPTVSGFGLGWFSSWSSHWVSSLILATQCPVNHSNLKCRAPKKKYSAMNHPAFLYRFPIHVAMMKGWLMVKSS